MTFRRLIVERAADGEYVVEVSSPSERPSSYSLHVSFDADAAHYSLQQTSVNCVRTTVAAGGLHRWTVTLRSGSEVPVHIAGPEAVRNP